MQIGNVYEYQIVITCTAKKKMHQKVLYELARFSKAFSILACSIARIFAQEEKDVYVQVFVHRPWL